MVVLTSKHSTTSSCSRCDQLGPWAEYQRWEGQIIDGLYLDHQEIASKKIYLEDEMDEIEAHCWKEKEKCSEKEIEMDESLQAKPDKGKKNRKEKPRN